MVIICVGSHAPAAVRRTVRARLLVFLYARRTHKHDNVLNRQEVVLIGLLLVAAVPATWMLVG